MDVTKDVKKRVKKMVSFEPIEMDVTAAFARAATPDALDRIDTSTESKSTVTFDDELLKMTELYHSESRKNQELLDTIQLLKNETAGLHHNLLLSQTENQTLKDQISSLKKSIQSQEQTQRALDLRNQKVIKENAFLVEKVTRLDQQVGETKSNEWAQRYHHLHESTSKQIISLKSEIDAIHCDWKGRVDRLETDLKRERYEKESISLSLKLKIVQCEKSDREAFHVKTMLNRVQEELKVVLRDRENYKFQVSEYQKRESVSNTTQQLKELEAMQSKMMALQQTIYQSEKKSSELHSELAQAFLDLKNEKDSRLLVEQQLKKLQDSVNVPPTAAESSKTTF
jgi:chromosome segregation ATPase